MKKKKKKALKRREVYKAWQRAWGIRIEDAPGDKPIKIDRPPHMRVKNDAS